MPPRDVFRESAVGTAWCASVISPLHIQKGSAHLLDDHTGGHNGKDKNQIYGMVIRIGVREARRTNETQAIGNQYNTQMVRVKGK